MPLRARVLLAITAVLLALGSTASTSAAVTRYTAPGATGPEPCAEANPCEIHNAVQNAADGDTVVIETGEYGSPEEPMNNTINATAKLNIMGATTRPRPVLHTNATNGLSVQHAESTLEWVEVRNAGVTAALFFRGALADQVVARSSRVNGYGCNVQRGTLRNSICSATGGGGRGLGAAASGAGGAPQVQPEVTIRGVTAWASGPNSSGIEVDSRTSIQRTYKVTNTIAQGTLRDVSALTDGGANSRSRIEIQHSNFDTPHMNGAGSSIAEGPGNVSAAPLLGGDFHQLAGSPTIDAGVDLAENGSFDFEFTPRPIKKTDIGADEFVPPPDVTTGAASSVTRTTATVAGTVNGNAAPETLYYFEFGSTPSYGQMSDVQTTPYSESGTAAVSANLSGLTPGTTYHYRLVASSAAGTTEGADQTFTTEAIPPPTVGGVKLDRRVFAIGRKLPALLPARARTPVGTTIRFDLNEPAAVKLSVRKLVTGRRVGTKCRATSRANARRPRCTRKVKVKPSIPIAGRAGLNRVRFQGRLDRRTRLGLGRYQLTIVATDAFGRISPAKRASFRIALR